jgi:hypothetical protein
MYMRKREREREKNKLSTADLTAVRVDDSYT